MSAVSKDVQKKTSKLNGHKNSDVGKVHLVEDHDTKVKDVGSSRRNITRKKGGNDQLFDSKKKKQGGAG